MPFEKGKSGNPGGRPKEKIITDAIRLAGLRDDKKRINEMIETVWKAAAAGEAWAVNYVTDRWEGKVAQAIIGGDEDDEAIKITCIERIIVRPEDKDR